MDGWMDADGWMDVDGCMYVCMPIYIYTYIHRTVTPTCMHRPWHALMKGMGLPPGQDHSASLGFWGLGFRDQGFWV